MSTLGAVKEMEWNLNGSQLISAGYDKMVRQIDGATGQQIKYFPHKQPVTAVCMHPRQQSLFVSGTLGGEVSCWDMRCNR